MEIKKILEELQQYLSLRQTGKTSLLKSGIDNYDRNHFVLVPTVEYGNKVLGTTKSKSIQKLVTFVNLNKLKGSNYPLIIDQEANLQIFSMALDKIQHLEMESDRKTKLSHEILDLAEMFQDDLHKIQNHMMDGLMIPFWNLAEQWRHRKRLIVLADYILSNSKKYTQKFKEIKSYYKFEI